MSVSETLKTRTGIKGFLLQNGDEDVLLAFEYTDKKTEVHLLKQECAPLYLEENSRISILNWQPGSIFLLAVYPNTKPGKGCLIFRVWDTSSVLGFTPKEIQMTENDKIITQDGKFKCQLNFHEGITDASAIKLDCLDSQGALLVENEILLFSANKKDSNTVNLQWQNSIKLKSYHAEVDITLLQVEGAYSLAAGENNSISFWSFDTCDDLSFKSLSVSHGPKNFHRSSKSTFLFTDDIGKLWIFSLRTNSLANIKLPGLQNGCHSFTITHQLLDNSAILAVCGDSHTINIYKIDEITHDAWKDPVVCERPLKILFSIAPVSALGFVRRGLLAMASSSNRSLSLWTVNTTN